MGAATQARQATVEHRAEHVFDRVRAFLTQHRLSPDPLHYAFAHRVVTNEQGALARSVAALTDGGIRLSAHDIEQLGGRIGALSVADDDAPHPATAAAELLVAQTQLQVEGFTDIVAAMRIEAEGFGRDLAQGAQAIHDSGSGDQVVHLTSLMIDRVTSAEARLEAATHEASELRAKLEEARGDARRDPLTDLPNRRAFEEAFHSACEGEASICLAVCDIDRFKRVNDQFGHSVGDRVLKAIAISLTEACGDQFVARYGGEEFIVLFSGIDQGAAQAILDNARETVAAKRYRLRESDEPLGAVTFSAGLSMAERGEALGAVFGRADALLYAAKNAGRNAVHAA